MMLGLYLLLVNLLTFLFFGADKQLARRGHRRIPEKTLFFLALVGGSFGALLGMILFHHKTRKEAFRLGIPGILFLQVVALFVLGHQGAL